MSGLYVNTNVNSLSAQTSLQGSMGSLSDVLTKLSTGLRINSAKDDPAGLIASEILRSDITGANQAIKNTQRANSMIAVADSALGQISNLLNDVKGLVNEAANTGAMSDEQIAANQLQVDSSLDAIDRIASTTEFMGRKLLDGTMSYRTEGLDKSIIEQLQISSANFGTSDHKAVTINVQQAAQKAMLSMGQGVLGADGARVQIGGADGVEIFKFNAYATAAEMADAINEKSDNTGVMAVAGIAARQGIINLTSAGAENDIILWAKDAGYDLGNYSVKFTAGDNNGIQYTITEPGADGSPGVIEFKLQMEEGKNAFGTADESTLGIFSKSVNIGNAAADTMTFNSVTGKNVTKVNWVVDAGANNPTAVLSDNGELTITVSGVAATTTMTLVKGAVDAIDGLTLAWGTTAADADVQALTTGPLYTTDELANNGLSVSARTGEDKYNNTDVVIVANASTAASTADGTAANATIANNTGASFTAKEVGEKYNDYKVTFAITGTGTGTVTYDATSNTFTVAGAATMTQQNAIDALNADELFSSMFTAKTTAAPTLAAAAGTGTAAGGVDKMFDFAYQDVPQAASTVFEDTNRNFIQIQANQAGSAYNGYQFKIVEDTNASGVGAAVDEKNKIITITTNDLNGASYAQMKKAVEDLKDSGGNSLFTLKVYNFDPTMSSAAKEISDYSAAGDFTAGVLGTTGTKPGQIGTDHGALIITASGETDQLDGSAATGDLTAQAAIDAFNGANNSAELKALFNLSGVQGAGTDGLLFASDAPATAGDTKVHQFSGALQGGRKEAVVTTAKELVDFINSDTGSLSRFGAAVSLNSGSGLGKLSLFNEAAYYGNPYDANALQFLGMDDSADIEMTNLDANGNKVAYQQLALEWIADILGTSSTALASYYENANILIEAKAAGGEYDDMVVRFKRSATETSSVTYTAGPSNAMAFGNISNDGTRNDGAFIFNALGGGAEYNNVTIQAKYDSQQQANAVFVYDEANKTFTISVKNDSVELKDVINAFNNDPANSELRSKFSFELDYSYTTPGNGKENDGTATFANLLGTDLTLGTTATLGNTGNTGGHTGGVLEVVVNSLDNGGVMDANYVIGLINNNSEISKLFTASNYGNSNGTGRIDARLDTVGASPDPNSSTGLANSPRMVTTGGIKEKGHAVIHLATDGAGNSITTAAELVAFFDSLTAEQTRGLSVSLVNPNGTIDTICDPDGGKGIVGPTTVKDDCDNIIRNNIVFGSSGSTTAATRPLAEIVALRGANAGFTLYGRNAGADYEGITFKYEQADPSASSPSVNYDAANKTITVQIIDGTTTAEQVADLINSDAATRDLFEVRLRGTGKEFVDLRDDSVVLANGTYETQPKGGARMLWNSDADENGLTLYSTTEGTSRYISVNVIEGTFGLKDASGTSSYYATGTDAVATINGMAATAKGRELSVTSSMLSMNVTLREGTESGTSTVFDITGGGAIFQIGPNVVSNQQVAVGLQSFRSEDLGGISGRLYQLREGENASLSTNTKLADKIVGEAITQVATARGRLGALQKTTFDSNIAALQDTVEQLTSARSDIVDADFATESSNLTKYQILVQSGSRVLGIANQLPQYAASLIG